MSSAFDYVASRAVGDRLIAKFGALNVAALRQTTNGGALPYAPTQTTADFPTNAVRVEFTFLERQSGDVLATDERWLVAAGPLALLGVTQITAFDLLIINGIVKPILLVKPLNPGGVAVFYDCKIRY